MTGEGTEEGAGGTHWMVWVLVIGVSMAIGALAVRWAIGPRPVLSPASSAAPASAPASAATARETVQAKAPDQSQFDLPGDEQQGDSSIMWSKQSAKPAETQTGQSAPETPAAPAEAGKSRELGFVKNALTKAAEKLLDNPKALAALFNNDYVVKGFMSRDTVRSATASKASLSAYLSDPRNLNQFMAKPAVQRGLNDQQLTAAMASTKLVAALMDTPGGKALLADQNAVTKVINANPALVTVLSNPGVASALAANPKTAGVLGSVR